MSAAELEASGLKFVSQPGYGSNSPVYLPESKQVLTNFEPDSVIGKNTGLFLGPTKVIEFSK